MKYGELKRRIEEYLARDMSEFKEKGDQGEGLFVTHFVKASRVRAIVDNVIKTKRQMIEEAPITSEITSDMYIAEIVCLNISKKLVDERYCNMYHSVPNGEIDIVTATDFLNYAFTTLGLDVTLDGRNVIDKYYELNSSKEADDTISILELHIPRGSSNGDVFKAVFPDGVNATLKTAINSVYGLYPVRKSWWDKPYAGKED